MKKLKLIIVTLVLLLCCISISAYDFSKGGIYYKITDSGKQTVAVTYQGISSSEFIEYTGRIIIPETVTYNSKTYKVTSIYGYAFDGCKDLTSVTIPNSVISIGARAFQDCNALTSVTIPNSVVSIGDYAFFRCHNLPLVNIPNGVVSIGEAAFAQCDGLTSIAIPKSVTSIGANAFYNCRGLNSVTILNGSIGDYAFCWCSKLALVVIGNSVKSIGHGAFDSCDWITTVINNSNLNITKGSQDYGEIAANATRVISGESIDGFYFEEIDSTYYLVGYVGDKKSIVLPTTYNGNNYCIASEAFIHNGLTSITIPNSVTSIGQLAFDGCNGLTSITIPSSVTEISDAAFQGCCSLSSVHITDIKAWCNINFLGAISNPLEYAQHLYMDGKEIKDLIIPDSVTRIGSQVFLDCSSLTSVTIPNSVTSIGDYAFEGCENLISVTSKAKNPPTLGYDVFDGTPVNNLYVPIGCKSAYEAASGWDWFENVVEIEEESIVSANDVNIVNDGVTWLSINMENKKSILGFQFKLTLPDGIVVDTDKNGKLLSVLSSRCNGFTLGLTAQGDNNYKVDCISLQNKEITGTEGELVKIKLTTNGEVAVGNSTITLSDIKLTTTEGTETITLYPANYTSKIAVLNYNLGDVDGKDGVSVTDAVMVVQDMFYKTPSNFIRETADVNGDGRIDGSDVVCILDILRTSSSKTQKDEWLEAE